MRGQHVRMVIKRSQVLRTWIITPAGTSYDEANALAQEEAESLITKDQKITAGGVLSHTGIPIAGQPGEEYWLAEFTLPPV
jgi:hypothetical protein